MLKQLQKRKDQKGFTIIEVLIVLAIAGLILLIVFLAVPALQRSSRNTQRKNDAAAIGGAIANFISNNNGTVPTVLGKDASDSNLDVCSTGGAATGGTTACSGNLEVAKMGFYTQGSVSIQTSATLPTADASKAVIVVKDTCDDANPGKVLTAGSSPRSAAVVYWTENGGGTPTAQCVEQ